MGRHNDALTTSDDNDDALDAVRELPAEGSQAAAALETPADERPVGTELSDATIVGLATVLEAVRSLTERLDTADPAQLATDRAYVRTLLVAYTHTIDELREAAARVCSARGWSPPSIAARP